MDAAAVVEAGQRERVLVGRVLHAVPLGQVHGDRGHGVQAGQRVVGLELPALGEFEQLLGEYLDLAGRRVQLVRHRFVAELLHGHHRRVLLDVHAHLHGLIPGGKLRALLARLLVLLLDALFLGLALGELVGHAELLGHERGHLVGGLALELGRRAGRARDHVARVGASGDLRGLLEA